MTAIFLRTLLACSLAGSTALVATPALAQRSGSAFSGINNSAGLFGSRSLGQGIGGGNGLTGSPGNMIDQAQSGAGQVQGGERFTREGRQPGQFVGADSADRANFFGQSQGFTGSGLEQFLGRAAQREFQNQGNSGRGSRAPLRPALSLGFNYSGPNETKLSRRLSERLSKLPKIEALEKVSVALQGRTAVLRGRVATEHDRRMMEQVALLEPGVSSVRNELVVGAATAEMTIPPAVAPSADDSVRPIPPPIPDGIPQSPSPRSDSPRSDSPRSLNLQRPELAPPVAPTAPSFDE